MSDLQLFYIGFDPGKDKCGIAIVSATGDPIRHEVIPAEQALQTLQDWQQSYSVHTLILGDQTGSRSWRSRIVEALPNLEIILIDERFSSQEARDRYWKMYPAQGLNKMIPVGMRVTPRPIDDLVAIILVERYLSDT